MNSYIMSELIGETYLNDAAHFAYTGMFQVD